LEASNIFKTLRLLDIINISSAFHYDLESDLFPLLIHLDVVCL